MESDSNGKDAKREIIDKVLRMVTDSTAVTLSIKL